MMTNWPFPHYVVDELFDPKRLDSVLEGWPNPDDREGWTHFETPEEEKWAWTPEAPLWPAAQKLVNLCRNHQFMDFLTNLTGIEGLEPDGELLGAGPHEIRRGGKLGIHVDFNRHPDGRDRRLNLLIYLNRGWQDEWGGELELWRPETMEFQAYSPVFNRAVIFPTTRTSWHGHPHPLTCPEGVYRRSMSLYYYTQPTSASEEPHDTIFMKVM